MTPEQFCYWLQGRAEMHPNNPPSAEEWKMIVEHLQLVFQKVAPKADQKPLHEPLQDYVKRMQDQNRTVVSPVFAPNPIVTC